MKCPTIEIDTGGQKVTINVTDFNPKSMIRWGDPIGTKGVGEEALIASPPAPVLKFSPKSKG